MKAGKVRYSKRSRPIAASVLVRLQPSLRENTIICMCGLEGSAEDNPIHSINADAFARAVNMPAWLSYRLRVPFNLPVVLSVDC